MVHVFVPTLLMDDWSAAIDWNAVNWIMKATEMTTTFFMMRPEGDLGDTAAFIRSRNIEGDIFVALFTSLCIRVSNLDISVAGELL